MKKSALLTLSSIMLASLLSCQSNEETSNVIEQAKLENIELSKDRDYFCSELDVEVKETVITPDGFTKGRGIKDVVTTITSD